MVFNSIERVRQRIKRYREGVSVANWRRFAHEVAYFFQNMQQIPEVAAIVSELTALQSEPAVKEKLNDLDHPMPGVMVVPPNEPRLRAAWWYGLLMKVSEREAARSLHIMEACVGSIGHAESTVRSFQAETFELLCDYFDDHLVDGDCILALLWRYKRLVEWCRREELANRQ